MSIEEAIRRCNQRERGPGTHSGNITLDSRRRESLADRLNNTEGEVFSKQCIKKQTWHKTLKTITKK